MIVVTGGAGFIGSQLVKGLNERGREDILVVDDLRRGEKFANLAAARIADYMDKAEFRRYIGARDGFPGYFSADIEFIFHQGACSTTTERDGQYMLDNNYTYSKEILHFAMQHSTPLVYASSAAVYGASADFAEAPANECPVNVYAYSKLLFDNYARARAAATGVRLVGLRYFNVYGPGEAHKGAMASVMFHFNRQLNATGRLQLFEGGHGYANGEQRRDFIFVEDVVKVNLWMMDHPAVSGIFNVGTGRANTFNSIARAVIDWHGKGEIGYIPFPAALKAGYQAYTQADLGALRGAGYTEAFTPPEQGVARYLSSLNP